MKVIEPGFFNIEDSHVVLTLSLTAAKEYTLGVIDKKPNARIENIQKVKAVVSRAKSTTTLCEIICNHVLKHPSEGLGVINPGRQY